MLCMESGRELSKTLKGLRIATCIKSRIAYIGPTQRGALVASRFLSGQSSDLFRQQCRNRHVRSEARDDEAISGIRHEPTAAEQSAGRRLLWRKIQIFIAGPRPSISIPQKKSIFWGRFCFVCAFMAQMNTRKSQILSELSVDLKARFD